MPLWVLCICCMAALPAGAQVPYPELHTDIGWSPANFTTVADIAAAFGNARSAENSQLGTTIPTTLTMPSQAACDAMSKSQKALYLINAERIARGLIPFQGVSHNIVSIAQAYAESLLVDNQFTHTLNGTSPSGRLNGDPAINGCSETGFVSSAPPIPMPVERSVRGWIYEDSSSSWGHRNTCFASLNDDFGTAGNEGLI
jgi:uncharacterized protein YkwD